jgi:hypothetical protein
MGGQLTEMREVGVDTIEELRQMAVAHARDRFPEPDSAI